MAADEEMVSVSAKDLECSICCSFFNSPVTLGCGHNFCNSCIQTYWTPRRKSYKCPLCQKSWQTKPELNKNTGLAALVEKVRGVRARSSVLPAAEPPCCSGPQAHVLCLTCARSYCLAHGQPHLEEEGALGTHVLVKPIRATWPCRDHARALQHFCPTHGFPVCPQCVGQHPNCQVVKLLQEFQHRQSSLSETKALLTESFQDMKKYLEELECAAIRKVEEERERGQREFEVLISTLTVEIDKLKDFRAERQHLLQDDWLELLKGQPQDEESCVMSPSKPENLVFHSKGVKSLVSAVEKLKQGLLENSVLEEFPLQEKQDQPVGSLLQHCVSSSPLEASNKPVAKGLKLQQFSQWAAHVTFDPETISFYHSLSAEKKCLSVEKVKQLYPPTPRRFSNSQALCSQSFDSGRHYWEVSTKDSEGWAIGVAEGRIGKYDRLGRNDFSWCVEWRNKQLQAWYQNISTCLTQTKPQTVGLLLDCESRVLSFYSADDDVLLHTYESNFQGSVFPAFWLNGLGKGEHLTLM
ncbi:E3 ubiquitin-protein ligase RNF135 isoform X2 [Microcaecilia unicolor]|uniref:E3 ubiquitin-protein ligase RNF135 isoform X2 n=1 Tax=Microcaecilia unicolor TaxID=1415580 RepID=A0A6P7YH36_9AMPH|nr:E3 ubiquitin-protein ligase RNF135 isoform X2 [Microcaecilia unicolor]